MTSIKFLVTLLLTIILSESPGILNNIRVPSTIFSLTNHLLTHTIALKLNILLFTFFFSLHHISSTIEDMDSSLLDVSADFISETPKKKPMSPKSFAKDVVERLAIVTPSGRVDAAEFLSSNTMFNL